MQKYRLLIEYDGTDFCGWQSQKGNRQSIQETIEKALKQILRVDIPVTGAGRTDAGVHAYGQVAHFKTPQIFTAKNLLYSLNAILPRSVTIKRIDKAKEEFHARYSAVRREYIYKMSFNRRSIERQYFYKLNYELDFALINEFIKVLRGYNSFKSLCKNAGDKHEFKCDLIVLEYKKCISRNELIFRIEANRFLHSMVRAVLGCLLDIGRGILGFEETKQQFLKGEKIKTTFLPANALFLNKIYYR
ncbi:MAG: tRNA pseudouridine(38-40) synthase TruA [Ignavibacteriae bacterium]|nr:tRNA pseudouridine(38-40) synthase TruA [Ignavibacteriota bacterium]